MKIIAEINEVSEEFGITKIRLTGGEPLLRNDITEIIEKFAKNNNIKELGLTTNGFLLEEYARDLRKAGLKSINVSLDTLNRKKFEKITGVDSLEKVLAGLNIIKNLDFDYIKLNMVLIKGLNDDELEELHQFARDNGFILQLINHMTLDKNKILSENNITQRPPRCDLCNRLRITADAKVRPCLFYNLEYDIKELGLKKAILEAVKNKPRYGYKNTSKSMREIGG